MGKPISKIIETLILPYQPVRYVVTNTERIILVTHDYKFANKIANAISKIENPKKFLVKLANK